MKTKIRTATLPTGLPAKFLLAAAAIVLALLAMPQFGNAQGIVRGAQEGSREGNRVAGPIGGVVGGAVGAGVGGAMGAVKGVFGINDRGHRCRGYSRPPRSFPLLSVSRQPSFRGDTKHRTRNLRDLGFALSASPATSASRLREDDALSRVNSSADTRS